MMGRYTGSWDIWLEKYFTSLLTAAVIVNAGALAIPILEPDGALYATIAKTIARTGDFINLRAEGKDWLDKPHFPFWMAAISMRIFGINGFAYKFPALLFWGLGAWYTFRLARLSSLSIARLAVLIYVSAAHLVISNNDVRAEPYLTGLVIGAVYHFYRASARTGWLGHLVAGSLMAACAMMTKGIFVLITIGAGFVIDWVVGGQWEQFLRPRWWLALLLTGIFILPELYCLYRQFDLHPEKEVFGLHGVSGLRFFFWDSQFGRFFNTGPIRGAGDPFFYFHTILWAFLPWSVLLYISVIRKCANIRRGTAPGDLVCAGALLVSFIMFSLSKFQLPHYLNLLFPFCSILTADWLYHVRRRMAAKMVVIIQHIIIILLPALLLILCWFFHFQGWPIIVAGIIVVAGIAFWVFRGVNIQSSAGRSYWMALLAYAFINFLLYPAILQYQAGSRAGKYLEKLSGQRSASTYMLADGPANYSFEFYCPGEVRPIARDSIARAAASESLLMFIPGSYKDSLIAGGRRVEMVREFPNFHISQLTGEFVNFRTRDRVTGRWTLVRVK